MVYRTGVKGVVLGVRAVAYVLLVSGIGALIVALLRGEEPNVSGFVPGVAVGYLLIALAGLAFVAASRLRDRRCGPLAVVAAVAVWLMASTYLFLSLPAGSLGTAPVGTLIGWLVVGGVLLAQFAVVLILGIIPVMTVLAWLADRIPTLRRHGVGEAIRRQGLPRF